MLITSEMVKDFVITGSIAAVAVFLVIALYHLIKLLKKLNGVVEANEKNVADALAKLPETIGSINGALADAKAITQKAGAVVGVIENGVNGVVASAKGTTSSVLEISRTLGDVIGGISGFLSRRKKERSKEESEE